MLSNFSNREVQQQLDSIDQKIVNILNRIYLPTLRYSIGLIFIWFGTLKPLGLSPAGELVAQTVSWIFHPPTFLIILGIWEIVIGITFLISRLNRVAILLLVFQMPGTLLPLIFLPSTTFTIFPFALTLEGQYIIKNLVVIGAAITIGSAVRKPN